MPIQDFFAIPIYYALPDGNDDMLSLMNEVDVALAQYPGKLTNPWDDSIFASFSYDTPNDFLKDTPLLKSYIGKHIEQYMKDIGCRYQHFLLKESWMNLSVQYSYQNYHNHISDISGVFYVKTSGRDGNLKFKSDSTGLKNSRLLSGISGRGDVEHEPQPGKIVLFPSFLEHAVLQNMTPVDRVSIAFNAYVY